MRLFNNITAGNPGKLIKPILYTLLSNLLNIVPFILVIEAVRLIFEPFSTPGMAVNIPRLWWVSVVLLLYMVVMFFGEIPAYRASYRGAYKVAAEGRANLAEHLRKLPLGYLSSRDPGDLANMMMGDFTLVEHCISHLMPQVAGALVLPVIALLGLSFLDWRMSLSMFAALPAAIVIMFASAKLQKRLSTKHMSVKINAANRLQEYLNGIRVIKSYNMLGERFMRLDNAFKALMHASIRLEGILGPVILTAVACMRLGLTIMVLTGTYLVLGGTLEVLTFVTFLVIGTRVFDPLTTALVNFAEFKYDEQAGERILALCKEPVMSGDKMPPEAHDVEFKNVTFGYGKIDVIKDLSIKLPQGTLTALVGPSGSGKSTLIKLIARFYDPSAGKVLFGGEDMKQMEPEALLKKISVVFQDVYLFQDTIGNNIRFGREAATQSEIEDAAKKACCHDFIMKLPKGYDTAVGEGGCTLSGGEKQRISIARAILKDAPVVLLDEATASLDPENELDVQKAINALIKGRTVIVIAHRLKTVRSADNIVVLDSGKVVAQGKHEALLAQKGLYAKLWDLQQESMGWRISS